MAPPLHVDPIVLDGAGKTMSTSATGWGTALSTLHSALAGTSGMGGDDPAGVVMARAYDKSAKELLEAMVDVANGTGRAADGIRASATNYSRAEAASNVDGKGGQPLPAAPPTPALKASTPPSAVGNHGGEPPGWWLVEPFIGMIWPDGDPGELRTAATAWSAAGSAFTGQQQGISGAKATVAAQQIPEGTKIDGAITSIDSSVTQVGQHCATISKGLNDYATHIDSVHAAIKDLLKRIANPMTGAKEIWDVITGNDDDEIKKIAHDISVIVSQFAGEVSALATLLEPIVAAVESIIAAMKPIIKMELEIIGDMLYDTAAPVVNAVATYAQAMINDPLGTVAMVGGAAMMAQGATLFGGGLLADATGVGAIFGLPANAVGAAEFAGGAAIAGAGALDLANEAKLNPVTVMHAHTGRPDEGVNRGDDRDRYGHFTGRDGSGYSKAREAEGIENYRDDTGRWVTTEQRKATVDGVDHGRFYDGLARKPDGTYEGVEVKSGGASRDPDQRAFDAAVSESNPAYVTITNEQGVVETVKVTSVKVVEVPGE